MRLPKQQCPGCEKNFYPFYREQNYCEKCRAGDNEYDRDCEEMNFRG